MDTTFGCCASLHEAGVHPRVMFGHEGLDHLRSRTRSGPGKALLDALTARVTPLAQRVLEADDLVHLIGTWNHNWAQPGTPIVQGIFDIAMAGALNESDELIEAVRRVLLILPEAEPKFGLARRPGYNLPGHLLWPYDLLHDRFSPEERRTITQWAVKTCIRNPMAMVAGRYYRTAGGNITLHGMDLPLCTILAIRGDEGVPDLSAELAEALRMMQATLHVIFNRDGYPEEDIGYGTVVAGRFGVLLEAVSRAGLFDGWTECPRVRRFGEAMLHMVQPWGGFLSNTGDHGDDFGCRDLILPKLAALNDDPTLLWLHGTLTYPSSGGDIHEANRASFREVKLSDDLPNVPATAWSLLCLDELAIPPVHPSQRDTPTAYSDQGRGIVSFRSGWEDDAAFVLFDGAHRSPSAQGHAHDSCGHFSLSAKGEYFAIDTGRYNVEQNCHNITLVDGKSGRSTNGEWRMSYYHGLLTDCDPHPFADYAAVDSSHQHNCYWARRHLGLVKGEHPYVWVVDDINKANDWAEYWWQLHTCPDNVIELAERSATIRGCQRGALLDVHFALPSPESFPKAHAIEMAQDMVSPSSYKYMDMPANAKNFDRQADMVHHAVYLRPRLLAKVSGYNGRFMSLMIPRDAGEQPAQVETIRTIDNVLAMRIRFAQVEDIVIFAYEHQLLEAADIVGRGRWCVVRRSLASGEVLDWRLGDGARLSAGDQVLA